MAFRFAALVLSALMPVSASRAEEARRPSNPSSAGSFFTEASRLAFLGRNDEALASAKIELARIEASTSPPVVDRARVFGKFGELARSAGDQAAVARTLDRLRAPPSDAAAAEERAKLLNKLGRFEEALRTAAAASALRPEAPGLHMQAGQALFGLDRRPEAIDAYRRVLELVPADYDAHLHLASAYRLEGRFEEANGLYRRAQALAPKRADAYYEEGYSRRDDGDTDGAIGALEAAIASNPKNPNLHHHMGVLLAGAGRSEDAVRAYEAALAACDSLERTREIYAHTATNLAIHFHALGRHDDSLRVYREALGAIRPRGSQWFLLTSGYLDELVEAGREAEARALVEKALDICQRDCSPMVNAGLSVNMARLLRASDPEVSREHGSRALDLIEANLPGDVTACFIADSALTRYPSLPFFDAERDRIKALGRSAAACSPKQAWSIRSRTALGDVLRARGDVRGAREFYCEVYRQAGEKDRAGPDAALRASGVADPASECGWN